MNSKRNSYLKKRTPSDDQKTPSDFIWASLRKARTMNNAARAINFSSPGLKCGRLVDGQPT